jgi:hypothetical protein
MYYLKLEKTGVATALWTMTLRCGEDKQHAQVHRANEWNYGEWYIFIPS